MDYSIIIYIVFGVLPSLTWLSFYLTKDLHPEPKRMILNVFLWGCLITLPVFFVQIGLAKILGIISLGLKLPSLDYLLKISSSNLTSSALIIVLIYWFLVIALSEEFFKFLVVKMKVISSPHLDEPLDIMLYMVVAALGFSAIENILYLFTPIREMSFMNGILLLTLIRFVGATFLHTLCSAVIGYSLAVSFCRAKKRYIPVILGISMATLLHGLYNFSIITLDGYLKFAIPAIIILALAILVFWGFERLKKMKSICKVK